MRCCLTTPVGEELITGGPTLRAGAGGVEYVDGIQGVVGVGKKGRKKQADTTIWLHFNIISAVQKIGNDSCFNAN